MSSNRGGGGERGRGRGRRGGRGRRPPPKEETLDDQMVEYWAKSDDPKLQERAALQKKERQEQLNKEKQEKLDKEMEEYWKKQKLDTETAETPAQAETS